MSDDSNVTEIQFSEDDLADLQKLGIDAKEMPPFNPVLRVWREVLDAIDDEYVKKPTPRWVNDMVQRYAEVRYAQAGELHERYFTKLMQLRTILLLEIESDDECLSYATPAEDAEHNAYHYKNLLLQWQLAILQWELDWDFADEHAGVELAAVSEVHRMFFSNTGITAYLDNIGFQYTEDDQTELAVALQELREGAQ